MARVEVVSDMSTGGFEDCALAIVVKTVTTVVSTNQRRQSNAHGRVCFMCGLTIWQVNEAQYYNVNRESK
jgi:hypothetical protein